jgi:uncharacterized protein (DUF2147 family)
MLSSTTFGYISDPAAGKYYAVELAFSDGKQNNFS